MSIQVIKSLDEFEKFISQDTLVVIDFHAVWCGPCRLIAPKLEGYAQTYNQAVFAKVDVDEVPDVAAKYEVRAMPTIMYFKSGQKLDEVVGANPQKIKEVIEKLSN